VIIAELLFPSAQNTILCEQGKGIIRLESEDLWLTIYSGGQPSEPASILAVRSCESTRRQGAQRHLRSRSRTGVH